MNFQNIHIGSLIKQAVLESETPMSRIYNYFKCSPQEVEKTFNSKDLDTEALLRWSKLLKYDFFRLYSQHMILYKPQVADIKIKKSKVPKTTLPQFRKSIYTMEVIDFILEQIETGKMTKNQVVDCYEIPRTTLYKWIKKYGK